MEDRDNSSALETVKRLLTKAWRGFIWLGKKLGSLVKTSISLLFKAAKKFRALNPQLRAGISSILSLTISIATGLFTEPPFITVINPEITLAICLSSFGAAGWKLGKAIDHHWLGFIILICASGANGFEHGTPGWILDILRLPDVQAVLGALIVLVACIGGLAFMVGWNPKMFKK